MSGFRSQRKTLVWHAVGLFFAVTLGFLFFYRAPILSSWGAMPTRYSGDALYVLAMVKQYSSFEFMPFLHKSAQWLNAPFGAVWSDFPFESLVYFPCGLLSRLLGVGRGTLVYLWLLHLLAAFSFYFTGTALGYHRRLVLSGATLFGLAPLGFVRGISHLTVTIYWHIPLMLLAISWFTDPCPKDYAGRRTLLFFCGVGALAGLLNPYYLFTFLWLSGIAIGGVLVQGDLQRARKVGIVLLCSVAGFLIQNIDTILTALFYGRNADAFVRGLNDLAIFGLSLPDLIFPAVHSSSVFQDISYAIYQSRVPSFLQGESQSAYIGLVSSISLVWMFVWGTINIAAKRCDQVSRWYWCSLAILAFAVYGGVNYLLGAFGFVLLRSTNRLSIFLMASVLLFACEALSCYVCQARTRRSWMGSALIGVTLIGAWDQIPPRSGRQAKSVASMFAADAEMVGALEQQLKPGSMVFQLPIIGFPEGEEMIFQMGNYEHFRPFIHSRFLRFSYGAVKGRGDEDWQKRVAAEKPATMVKSLEEYGFSALMINRKGFPDFATKVSSELESQGYTPAWNRGDFLVYFLNPSAKPSFPKGGFWGNQYDQGLYEPMMK
jgi:hypothetical protein